MAKIIDDHVDEIIEAKNQAIARAMEEIGIDAEKFAKALCPVGTVESTGIKGYRGGTLRNSITHKVTSDGPVASVAVGSNVEYAPFVELGTGPFFVPPPEWETFEPYKKKGGGHGYVRPRPYLRPALADHLDHYNDIIKGELS